MWEPHHTNVHAPGASWPFHVTSHMQEPAPVERSMPQAAQSWEGLSSPSTPFSVILLFPWLSCDTWLIYVLLDSGGLFLSEAFLKEDLCFKWFMAAWSLSVGISVCSCVSWHGCMRANWHVCSPFASWNSWNMARGTRLACGNKNANNMDRKVCVESQDS